MIAKNITMQEIAKRAEVSLVTVERVLNNRANVKESTRNKVLQAAQELNYAGNALASALRARRNPKKVAALLHAPSYNQFSQAIWNGINSALLNKSEYPVELKAYEMASFDIKQQLSFLNEIIAENYDGLIIRPINHPEIKKLLAHLREKGTKIIFVVSDLEADCADLYVGTNPYQAGRKAASVMGKLLAYKYGICNNNKRLGDTIGDATANSFKESAINADSPLDSNVVTPCADNTFSGITPVSDNCEPKLCAILTGSSLSLSHTQKIEGIRNFFSENYERIKLLGPFEIAKDFSLAKDIINLLCRDYKVSGIIYQSFIAEHIMQLQPLINEDIVTCAFTSTQELQDLLTSNSITYAIDEKPVEQGYEAMNQMLDLLFASKQPNISNSAHKIHICIDSAINCGA